MAGHNLPSKFELPYKFECVECPERSRRAWVYILLMRNNMLYVGQTKDVEKRMRRHADGSGSRQAKQLKEFILVFVEGPMEPAVAVQRERQLKKWSRAKKLALVRGDKAELKRLSRSRD